MTWICSKCDSPQPIKHNKCGQCKSWRDGKRGKSRKKTAQQPTAVLHANAETPAPPLKKRRVESTKKIRESIPLLETNLLDDAISVSPFDKQAGNK